MATVSVISERAGQSTSKTQPKSIVDESEHRKPIGSLSDVNYGSTGRGRVCHDNEEEKTNKGEAPAARTA